MSGKLEMPKLQSVSVSFESKDVIGSRLFWEDQVRLQVIGVVILMDQFFV